LAEAVPYQSTKTSTRVVIADVIEDCADFVMDVVIAGDDDIRVGAGWIDVLFRHRQYGGRILFKNAFASATALLDIAFYATLEADLFSQVDIDFRS